MFARLIKDIKSSILIANSRDYLRAFSAYLLISVLLTWPLVFHLNSSLFGGYGDARGDIWGIWLKKGTVPFPLNCWIDAPFCVSQIGVSQPILEFLVRILARSFGALPAYNLFVFFSFPLTALAAFLFLDFLLKDRLAAFFGGLVFGFCPASVMQAMAGHLTFCLNATIPLFFLVLFYNRAKRNWGGVFGVAFSYAALTLTCFYWGYFALYFVPVFLAFDFLTLAPGEKIAARALRNYFLCAVLAAAILTPFVWKDVVVQVMQSRARLVSSGRIRPALELLAYSARPWDYFLPSVDHPILGRWILNFSRDHLYGGNLGEQTLYLGFVPMAMAAAGLVLARKNILTGERRRIFFFFVAAFFWSLYLSAPPYLPIGSVKHPWLKLPLTPAYFGFLIAPMFRVFARFGIWAEFFLAGAAALSFSELRRRVPRGRFRAWACVLCPIFAFEFWSVPPNFAAPVETPAVYQWLAKQPGDFLIAEYPMMPGTDLSFYDYLFWQRVHHKRMVNGAQPDNAEAWAFYQKVKEWGSPGVVRRLKSVGVKYAIIHPRMYEEGVIPSPIKKYFPPKVAALHYGDGRAPKLPSGLGPCRIFGRDMACRL